MRAFIFLIIACLTSFAVAAGAQDSPAPPAADETKTETETEEAAPDLAVDEDEGEEEESSEEDILAVLEAAAQEAEKDEKERLANAEAERLAAKGEKHEKLTTTKGQTYQQVVIRGVDEVGVKIMHQAGTARIRFAELPKELQQRFGYDPEKAQEARAREKALESARERAAIARLRVESGLPPERGSTRPKTTRPQTTRPQTTRPSDAGDAPIEGTEVAADDEAAEEADTGTPTTIAGYKARIARLEAGIEKLREVAKEFEEEAKKVEARMYKSAAGGGNPGGVVGQGGDVELDASKLAKVKEWRDKAEAENKKVAAARGMISKYRREMKKLERGN